MKKHALIVLFLFSFNLWSFAQEKPSSTGQLLHSLNKLEVVGSAMYVAAHPDDENTLMITWLENEKKVRTAYIAMTRGDGGQNLIGTEKDEFAGLLRTNELLQARSIDGGEQYFTRANDFGYCKTTEEALAFWGKELVLSDLVYRIRKFQPDVMITRFPPDSRAGHGHHSASSLLAEEAFDAAADPDAFPEQLKEVAIWQVKRLVWNFYNRGFTNTPPEEASNFITIDIGGYNALLGESYGEIGSRARSMHKSQGFGAGLFRGERLETLKHTKGEPAENDLFDGINTSWSRIKGGNIIGTVINDIKLNFNPETPENSVLALNQLYKLMQTLPDSPLLQYKLTELKDLILDFAGIHMEVNARDYNISKGDSLEGTFRLINRSNLNVKVSSITIPKLAYAINSESQLIENTRFEQTFKEKIPKETPYSQPYWLQEKHAIGSYHISDESLKGLPLSPPVLTSLIQLNIEGLLLEKEVPLTFKYVEPSFGEIYQPLVVVPAVTVTANTSSLIFGSDHSQEFFITVKSARNNIEGIVHLDIPNGWTYAPLSKSFSLKKKNEELILKFSITPPTDASQGLVQIKATVDGQTFGSALNSIKYPHIPETVTFPASELAVLKLDLKKKGKKVGYIVGAGDDIPQALARMGYTVDLLSEDDLSGSLAAYKAILVGIRAYNTNDWLPFYHERLMTYVKDGGNLICQYQTSGRGTPDFINKMGPYPFSISRDRVSEEDAEVRFVDTSNTLLSKPNKLSSADFQGWVQERGLYFATDWHKDYKPLFSMNDKGETAKEGSLIHTAFGKGNYVYTGLSFFRELPAGVPGAYRLLANLISM